jgi:hypothetical protein
MVDIRIGSVAALGQWQPETCELRIADILYFLDIY